MGKKWQYEYTVVLMHWFILGFVSLDRFLPTYLFPMILPDLKMDFTQAGMIMSILGLVWGIMAIFGGGLSDKYGRKTVIVPATIIFSLTSWASGIARSFTQLSIVRGIMGGAEGAYIPSSISMISEEAKPSRRGFMLGLHHTAFTGIGAFFGAIYATQIATRYGWRWAFYLTIIPGIILAAVHWAVIREPKSVRERIDARKRGEVHKIVSETGEHLTWTSVFKFRNVILMVLVSLCFMTWLWVYASFATLYITKVRNLSILTAGFVMSAWGLGGFIGQWGVPALSDIIGRKTGLILGGLITGIATLSLVVWGANPAILYIASFFAGGCGNGVFGIYLSLIPSESVPFGLAGLAIGLVTGIGEIFGGGVLPTIGGMMADAYGLASPMILAGITPLIATVLAFFVIETAPRKKAITAAISPAEAYVH